jgi:hypothetical protein
MINGCSKYEANGLSSSGGKFSMQMAMECVEEKVKRLVGGRSCSLERQALPKYKTETP